MLLGVGTLWWAEVQAEDDTVVGTGCAMVGNVHLLGSSALDVHQMTHHMDSTRWGSGFVDHSSWICSQEMHCGWARNMGLPYVHPRGAPFQCFSDIRIFVGQSSLVGWGLSQLACLQQIGLPNPSWSCLQQILARLTDEIEG